VHNGCRKKKTEHEKNNLGHVFKPKCSGRFLERGVNIPSNSATNIHVQQSFTLQQPPQNNPLQDQVNTLSVIMWQQQQQLNILHQLVQNNTLQTWNHVSSNNQVTYTPPITEIGSDLRPFGQNAEHESKKRRLDTPIENNHSEDSVFEEISNLVNEPKKFRPDTPMMIENNYLPIKLKQYNITDETEFQTEIMFKRLTLQDSEESKNSDRTYMNVKYLLGNTDDSVCSAISLGPVVIQWTEEALCKPKRTMDGTVILAVEVGTLYEEKNITDSMKELADMMHYWNTTKHFDPIHCSYNHFVTECFSLISRYGIDVQFKGNVHNYIETSLKQGRCHRKVLITQDVYTFIDKQMLGEYSNSEGYLEFPTHEKLDEFIRKSHKMNSSSTLTEFWKLLKGLDRGFWFEGERTDNCPFDDPSKTHTNWKPSRRNKYVSTA